MQISSTRRSLPITRRSIEPRGVSLRDLAPTAGGLVLGGATAALGYQLADTYGHEIARTLIHKGLPLVQSGVIPLDCALRALPYITDRTIQLRAGAIGLGLAGFAVGAALLWPRGDAQ